MNPASQWPESTLSLFFFLSTIPSQRTCLCHAHLFENFIGDTILWIIEIFGTETINETEMMSALKLINQLQRNTDDYHPEKLL